MIETQSKSLVYDECESSSEIEKDEEEKENKVDEISQTQLTKSVSLTKINTSFSSKNSNEMIQSKSHFVRNISSKPRISINNEEEINNIPTNPLNCIEIKSCNTYSPNSKKEKLLASSQGIFGKTKVKSTYEEMHLFQNEFEKISIFKKYFPNNNFTQIQKRIQKNKEKTYQQKKSKANRDALFKKYSQYTFYCIDMHQKINNLENKKTKVKIFDGNKKLSIEKMKNKTFLNMIASLIKRKKEKNFKKKWWQMLGNIFKS